MGLGEQFELTLNAARTGAEWALAALYRDLQPRLVRYLLALAPGDGEDVASEVWIDVAAGLGSFEGDEQAFRSFVFTIARRRLIDARRREARRRTEAVPIEILAERAGSGDVEGEALAGFSLGAALARLAVLPPEQAEVILLRVLAGLDVDRVATLMGKSPGSVRVLQHRGLRRLAEELAREAVTQ